MRRIAGMESVNRRRMSMLREELCIGKCLMEEDE